MPLNCCVVVTVASCAEFTFDVLPPIPVTELIIPTDNKFTMSTVSTIHTLNPGAGFPEGYFDNDNIVFVQRKIGEVLKRRYGQDILFDRAGVIRLMERSLMDRLETVPKMNQRAVMYGSNEFMNHQDEINKRLKWEAHYTLSQRMYDPSVDIVRFDPQLAITSNWLGKSTVGGTKRFYFT